MKVRGHFLNEHAKSRSQKKVREIALEKFTADALEKDFRFNYWG